MERLSPEARYHRDPAFKAFADWMEAAMHNLTLTPTEVREAAMLACVHFELRTTRATQRVLLTAEGMYAAADDTSEPPPVMVIGGRRYARLEG